AVAPYARLPPIAARTEERERSPHEPLGKARGGAEDARTARGLPAGREREHAVRRAQHAPALFEVEHIDRFVEAEPADPPLLERRRAPGVGHEEVHDGDPIPFLLLLDASQPPDRPRAHARLLAGLALRGVGGGLSVLDMAFRKDPPVAPSAGLDEEIAGSFVRQLEDDGSAVRRAAQCRSPTARCASSGMGVNLAVYASASLSLRHRHRRASSTSSC